MDRAFWRCLIFNFGVLVGRARKLSYSRTQCKFRCLIFWERQNSWQILERITKVIPANGCEWCVCGVFRCLDEFRVLEVSGRKDKNLSVHFTGSASNRCIAMCALLCGTFLGYMRKCICGPNAEMCRTTLAECAHSFSRFEEVAVVFGSRCKAILWVQRLARYVISI